ncbi:MAG: response regulator [Actinobacteria bacterium]|nr:response regulator [Actinomycetota bacterium]
MSLSDEVTIRILLVEDSVDDIELLTRELRLSGISCRHEQVDTRAGWERAIAQPDAWDVALFDYSLPQLDTLKLLNELRERAPELPAIVVSGTITEENAVGALRAGARDFITKANLVRLAPAVLREVAASREIRERRSAEAALGESEARFDRFVEHAQDLVLRYQLNPPHYDYVSPSVETMLGYPPEAFYGDPELGMRIIHPEEREAFAAAYAEDPERPFTGRVVAADGHVVWLDRRQVAIRDDAGEIVALEAVARDVTEQVLAHELVQSEERKFRAVFDGALDALLLADDDRVYIDANPAACRLLGLTHAELVGRRIEDFAEPAASADVIAGWNAFIADGRQEGQMTLLRPDGESRLADFRATANVKDGLHLSILRDITEQRTAETALHETDERVRTMLEELPLVVFSVPVEPGGVSYVSPTGEKLFGLPNEAWNERPELFWEAVHPDDRAVLQAAQSLDRSATDFRMRHPDGRELSVHGQNRIVRGADGAPTHYQGFITDITELTTSREALRDSEDRLRQAQKMEAVGQLAGGIAHDFNNLLTIINGYGDIALSRCNGDESMHNSITEIRRAGDRAAELTHQLLAFSRRQVLKPEILDVNDVVSEHASMLTRLLGEDIDLHVALNARDGYVEADPGQLAQVILNLAVNARDAMPDGGELTIRTDSLCLDDGDAKLGTLAGGDYVVLEVRDNGIGMNAETTERVFEPFFTTKGVGLGTGLGLSTVLGIVEQSRGRVAIESELDEGTSFCIYLPQVAARLAPAVVVRDVGGGNENVLLVEDDPGVRALVEDILTERGYNVLSAATPSEAIEVAAAYDEEIQLVVTDVVMPAMNGRQLAERLEAVRPSIRVLYMSGYTSDAIIARGVLPSGMRFLQKPFTASQLAANVREALAPVAV